MAIRQTMSNPSDWMLHAYQTGLSNTNQFETPATITPVGAANPAPVRNTSLLPADQGRISKPLRRRSRASRRAPTTLLNTDAANFRAMVQRFTGGPAAAAAAAASFPASSHQLPNGGAILGFAPHTPTTIAASASPASGFHVQYPKQPQQQQQQQHLFVGGPSPPAAAADVNGNIYGNYRRL